MGYRGDCDGTEERDAEIATLRYALAEVTAERDALRAKLRDAELLISEMQRDISAALGIE